MQRRTLAALATLAFASLAYARPAAAQSPPAAPTAIALGDWQLTPSLEVRTRSEYRRDPPDLGGFDLYGRLSPRVRDAWVVAERARLGLGHARPSTSVQSLGVPKRSRFFGVMVSGIRCVWTA